MGDSRGVRKGDLTDGTLYFVMCFDSMAAVKNEKEWFSGLITSSV